MFYHFPLHRLICLVNLHSKSLSHTAVSKVEYKSLYIESLYYQSILLPIYCVLQFFASFPPGQNPIILLKLFREVSQGVIDLGNDPPSPHQNIPNIDIYKLKSLALLYVS